MCASIENQKVRRIVEENGKPFKGFSKKKTKKHEDIIQFKIEFLLPLTACRKNAWTNACRDVKTKMSDVENQLLFSFV